MASSRDTGETVNGKKHGYWITYYASGVKGTTFTEKRMDLGSITTKMGTNQAKPPSAMENMRVLVSLIMKTGTLDPVVPILNMRVNPMTGKGRTILLLRRRW